MWALNSADVLNNSDKIIENRLIELRLKMFNFDESYHIKIFNLSQNRINYCDIVDS